MSAALDRLRRFARSWQSPTYVPAAGLFYPEDVILFVTERCNMRCRHCMFIERVSAPGSDFPRDLVLKMAASIPPVRSWNITGGEPFLRSDLEDLLLELDRCNHPEKIQVNTNALLTDRTVGIAERLSDAMTGLLVMQVSIDGLAETHEEVRNLHGCFPRVEETLRQLVALRDRRPDRLAVVASCVINERNYRELPALFEYLYRDMRVVPTFDFARGSGYSTWNVPEHLRVDEDPPVYKLPPVEELPAIYAQVRDFNRRMGTPVDYFVAHLKYQAEMYRTGRPSPVRCTTAGRSFAVIYSDGRVAACEFTQPFADLNDHDGDLLALWNSEAATARRAEITGCWCTHACFLTTSMEKDRRARLRLLRDL